MTRVSNQKHYIIKADGVLFIILIISGYLLFHSPADFEKLKAIHIEKEKKIGDEKVNQQLYLYYDKFHSDKSIVTDYMYLSLLPGINKFFKYGRIQELKPSDPLLTDEKTGFLLMTTLFDTSKVLPVFIGDSLKSGKYTEIFNINDCVLIKIR